MTPADRCPECDRRSWRSDGILSTPPDRCRDTGSADCDAFALQRWKARVLAAEAIVLLARECIRVHRSFGTYVNERQIGRLSKALDALAATLAAQPDEGEKGTVRDAVAAETRALAWLADVAKGDADPRTHDDDDLWPERPERADEVRAELIAFADRHRGAGGAGDSKETRTKGGPK